MADTLLASMIQWQMIDGGGRGGIVNAGCLGGQVVAESPAGRAIVPAERQALFSEGMHGSTGVGVAGGEEVAVQPDVEAGALLVGFKDGVVRGGAAVGGPAASCIVVVGIAGAGRSKIFLDTTGEGGAEDAGRAAAAAARGGHV